MKKAILALAAVVLTSSAMAPAAFATPPKKPVCPMDMDVNMPCEPDAGTDVYLQTDPTDPFDSASSDPTDPFAVPATA